jgi:hypothetical protein
MCCIIFLNQSQQPTCTYLKKKKTNSSVHVNKLDGGSSLCSKEPCGKLTAYYLTLPNY